MNPFADIKEAWNIEIMDVDQFIRSHGCFEVTSPFAHVPSSDERDPDGLFSERIFGDIASQTRLIKHGWIRLNCKVFHPIVFQNLQALKRFYVEIMSGRSYAVWDYELKDFVRAAETDEGAQTGFAFFLKYFPSIQFQKNASLKRNDKINVILKYRDRLLIDKCLVAPAAIRELKDDGDRQEKDSINNLYLGLMMNAKAMPPGGENDSIYDVVHYSIQRKVVEIYDYLMNFICDKRGFLSAKLGARAVAQGTRNVITATNLEANDPSDPQYHKVEEVKVPLYQAAKGYSSLVAYQIKSAFYSPIIAQGQDQVPLINVNTLRLEYVGINDKDKDYLLTTEGINKTIDRFRDPEFRFRPVTAMSGTTRYYLYLVYEDGDRIHIFRNIDEFKTIFESTGKTFNESKVRPLTYAELLYICTYTASYNKSGTITRYPVADEQSIFPARTHLMTTQPSGRIVHLMRSVDGDDSIMMPEYPVIGASFIDAVMIHPSRLKGLQADFDGNCVVGDTTIQIRFKQEWLDKIKGLDYSISGQDVNKIFESFVVNEDLPKDIQYIIGTIKIRDLPQPGEYKLDRNGAKVYTLPEGCEVWSFDITKKDVCWSKFSAITVEENCECGTAHVGDGDYVVGISSNPSMAVYNESTGGLDKMTPSEAIGKWIPVIPNKVYSESFFKEADPKLPKLVLGSWCKMKEYTDIHKETVYDLLVPDTKVFIVNDGIVIYDTISWIPILGEEANEECNKYYESLGNYINTDGSPTVVTDDLCAITCHAMTIEPPDGLDK